MKTNLIENAKKIYETRNDIINVFKKLKTEEDEQTEEDEIKKLPPWVEVSRKRFDEIKVTVNKAKKGKIQVKLLGRKVISTTDSDRQIV